MEQSIEVADTTAGRNWLAVFLKFIALLVLPTTAVIALWGMFGQSPVLGFALLGVIAGVVVFPQACQHLFGLSRDVPRLLLVVAMLPACLFSAVLLIAHNEKTGKIQAAPAKVDTPAIPALAQKPVAPPVQQRQVRPAEMLSWADNMLSNRSSQVLLGARFECTEYFKNGKVAAESKVDAEFTSDFLLLPVLPGESRKFKPKLSFSGNKDDLAASSTKCTISDAKLVELNPKQLPISIALSVQKTQNFSGDKLVATVSNKAGSVTKISRLEIACVVKQDRALTNEEMMDQMKYATYTDDDMVHKTRYYEQLVARPYYTSGSETKLEIPANGKLDVRLYTKGGMFSSDKEVIAGMDFNSQQCWILN